MLWELIVGTDSYMEKWLAMVNIKWLYSHQHVVVGPVDQRNPQQTSLMKANPYG